MSAVSAALTPVCPQIESQLKPRLSGLFSGMIRGYLPQFWAFTTEAGTATLRVDSGGNATVVEGGAQPLDVGITWTQAQLEWAIVRQGNGPRPSGADPKVVFYTGKGRTAFGFLKGRFNL